MWSCKSYHVEGARGEQFILVMHDIVSTMFNRRFIEEMFKPQAMYTKSSMRMLFDRLAHSSIMRLNTASMDKVSSSGMVCDGCSVLQVYEQSDKEKYEQARKEKK